MKYRDEIHIAMMALVFSCAMFAIYAVVPKDAIVAAKARATVTEAPETAAEAEAIRSSQEEDAGFPIYTQNSNYDYDDSSDDSDNSDTGTDTSDTTTSDTTTSDTTTSDTDNSSVDSSTDNNYDDGSSDNVVDEGISQPGDYDYPDAPTIAVTDSPITNRITPAQMTPHPPITATM